ncbi:MAG: GTP 3',8-cyclase MoaA [Euzebyaceae bacterium]|jgi:cyclic pyranopterin phosphate synthase|nr:GTP 3',8-cyclase MoaA [Euzebyaceae bacterium]
MASLVDTFGRVADDLRVSVTDKCNFRCTYCMPAEGLPWLPKDQLLTYEELTRLVGIGVDLGVRTVRVTGGEPLVRREVPAFVGMLRALGDDRGVPLDLSVTTNGQLLGAYARPLADAGLDRVNVSCDSLQRHRFAEMTRRDALAGVLAGLRAADEAGLRPVKLNTVVIRGTNDDELLDFARLARETGYEVRFIEYMPLDAEEKWTRELVVPAREVLDRIAATFPLRDARHDPGPEPATTFTFADGAPGAVGVIPSVTEPFCDACNRIRITPEGGFRTCLFSLGETDLRGPLRAGASDADLAALMTEAVRGKWAGHKINDADFVRPAKSMSMIGG